MGFSIGEGIGPLGILIAAVLVATVAIVLFWLVTLTRQARREVLDEDGERDEPVV